MAKAPSLSKLQFDRLYVRVELVLTHVALNFATAVQDLFIKEAANIAKCNQLQLEKLDKMIRPFGAGYHMRDLVKKSVLLGQGLMAAHVVRSPINRDTFDGLPKRDRRRLNIDDLIDVKQRNRVVRIRYSQLTEKQFYQVISGNNPSWGILTPQQQVTRKRGTPQNYFRVAAWRYDRQHGHVILSCQQGDVECKVRIPRKLFLDIAGQLPRSGRGSGSTVRRKKPVGTSGGAKAKKPSGTSSGRCKKSA